MSRLGFGLRFGLWLPHNCSSDGCRRNGNTSSRSRDRRGRRRWRGLIMGNISKMRINVSSETYGRRGRRSELWLWLWLVLDDWRRRRRRRRRRRYFCCRLHSSGGSTCGRHGRRRRRRRGRRLRFVSNVSGSRAGTQRLYDLLEPHTLPLALARVRVQRKAAHGERRQQRGTQERAMAWAETQSRPSHGPPPLPVASSPEPDVRST